MLRWHEVLQLLKDLQTNNWPPESSDFCPHHPRAPPSASYPSLVPLHTGHPESQPTAPDEDEGSPCLGFVWDWGVLGMWGRAEASAHAKRSGLHCICPYVGEITGRTTMVLIDRWSFSSLSDGQNWWLLMFIFVYFAKLPTFFPFLTFSSAEPLIISSFSISLKCSRAVYSPIKVLTAHSQ